MRLDKYIVINNEVRSREIAKALILNGNVCVNNQIKNDPKYEVKDNDIITVENNEIYVGRGAYKLLDAIKSFNIDFCDKNVIDVGSSTGGFTQVALLHGAKHVTSIDVGTNQLHESLRNNNKVTSIENTDIRNYEGKFDLLLCDVSFISLSYLTHKFYDLLVLGGEGIILIKPQFEVGSGNTKDGIVIDEKLRKESINKIIEQFKSRGFNIISGKDCDIRGGEGNQEYLLYVRR